MNKRFSLLLLAGALVISTTNTMRAMESAQSNPLAKAGMGLVALGALGWTTDRVFKSEVCRKICKKIGLSPVGTQQVAFLSTSALTLSFLASGNEELSNSLVKFAWTAPLIGLVNVMLKQKTVREIISKVPGIGSYLVCPLSTTEQVEKMHKEMADNNVNQNEIDEIKICKGSCHHCSAIDAIRLVTGWTVAKYATPIALDWLRTNVWNSQ